MRNIFIGMYICVAVVIFTVSYYTYNKIETIGIYKITRAITGKGVQVRKSQRDIENERRNKYALLGFCAGTVCGVSLLWGTSNVVTDSIVIGAISGAVVLVYTNIYDKMILGLKRKEVRTLFSSVENLMLSGVSFEKALRETSELLNHLKPAVNKSVAYFPNTNEVLNSLREEINLPEGDILVSLLKQLKEVGAGRFEGAIQKEIKVLEDMQASSDKVRIKNVGNAIIIPRIMSLAVIVLMLIGTLIVKMESSFSYIGL